LYESEPHIYINALDAKKRNIKNSDIVTVYNDRGSCKVKATISEAVPPGVVQIPHGWWPKQFIEGHLQNLVMSLATPEIRDESREIYWAVASERGGIRPFGETWFAYSPDTIFDCLCEVKKVEGDEK
jgi:molybdopterin-containing oxidoreductase family molybdopterin binding subunit